MTEEYEFSTYGRQELKYNQITHTHTMVNRLNRR